MSGSGFATGTEVYWSDEDAPPGDCSADIVDDFWKHCLLMRYFWPGIEPTDLLGRMRKRMGYRVMRFSVLDILVCRQDLIDGVY